MPWIRLLQIAGLLIGITLQVVSIYKHVRRRDIRRMERVVKFNDYEEFKNNGQSDN